MCGIQSVDDVNNSEFVIPLNLVIYRDRVYGISYLRYTAVFVPTAFLIWLSRCLPFYKAYVLYCCFTLITFPINNSRFHHSHLNADFARLSFVEYVFIYRYNPSNQHEQPRTAEFLCGLESTDVTLDPPSEPPLYLPRQTWVIEKKLSERSSWLTQEDVTDGLGLPFAAAKFLCYRKENPNKKAFMRIYLQIPISGTQYQSPQIRRNQATKPLPHTELAALKELKIGRCDVVPELLAYQEGKQGEDSIVPGGYITYVVWDKVPGKARRYIDTWRYKEVKELK
jgi:hypothetical protein